MPCTVDGQEGQVAAALDCANLVAVTSKLQVVKFNLVESILAGPLEGLGPAMVSEVVADVVLKTC